MYRDLDCGRPGRLAWVIGQVLRGLHVEAVRTGLEAFNAKARGSGGRVARALVLPDAPDPVSGEITDKGYIAQALARQRRADAIERLFADPPSSDVMVFP